MKTFVKRPVRKPIVRLTLNERCDQVVTAIEDGAATLQEIADALGLTRQRIDQIIKNHLGDDATWAVDAMAENLARQRGIDAFGETKTFAQWARDPRGVVPSDQIRRRVQRGWAPEEAISTPSGERESQDVQMTQAQQARLVALVEVARDVRPFMKAGHPVRDAALERDRFVRELLDQGVKGRQMALACGVGLGTVYSWLSYTGWRAGRVGQETGA